MFCTKCGTQMPEGAETCPHCGTAVAVPEKVPNHMVGAILVTVFCCVIGGIVSIVYASQVNTKLAQGDIEGAKASAKSAKNWIIASVIIGLVVSIVSALIHVGDAMSKAGNL